MTHQPHDHRTTTWGKHAMPELTDLNEDSPAKLSRRNVVVGTAWAVPAIALVGAAPAFAATLVGASATKKADGSFEFTITTTGAKTGDQVEITSITGNNPALNMTYTNNPASLATNSATITGTSTVAGNGRKAYTVNYWYTGPTGSQVTGTTTLVW